jgi:hypothetical protein
LGERIKEKNQGGYKADVNASLEHYINGPESGGI